MNPRTRFRDYPYRNISRSSASMKSRSLARLFVVLPFVHVHCRRHPGGRLWSCHCANDTGAFAATTLDCGEGYVADLAPSSTTGTTEHVPGRNGTTTGHGGHVSRHRDEGDEDRRRRTERLARRDALSVSAYRGPRGGRERQAGLRRVVGPVSLRTEEALSEQLVRLLSRFVIEDHRRDDQLVGGLLLGERS